MKVYIGKYKKNGDRKIDVHIDDFDTWNVDSTLALIIAPLLRKFKEAKASAPKVENSDVPEHLHSNSENGDDLDPHWFARWSYVLDEMIFAFESYQTDWEDQFWFSNENVSKPGGVSEYLNMTFDREGFTVYQSRIANGFRLFGKYYGNLWS